MDLDLLAGVADARPDWSLVMLGPVVKIDEASLPRRRNIHWLGGKSYRNLPAYMAGWDVAMLPFARNASTRFISPTKTPEYLAAGKPVVSTSIRDVVRSWGSHVRVADQPAEFVASIEACLHEDSHARLPAIDRALAGTSWDATWNGISRLMSDAVRIATQNEGSCTTI
jgi:UDP-galactopyranose mutase